jgi:hypothetical protein
MPNIPERAREGVLLVASRGCAAAVGCSDDNCFFADSSFSWLWLTGPPRVGHGDGVAACTVSEGKCMHSW